MTLFYLLIRAFLISATFFKIKVSFHFRRELISWSRFKGRGTFSTIIPPFDRSLSHFFDDDFHKAHDQVPHFSWSVRLFTKTFYFRRRSHFYFLSLPKIKDSLSIKKSLQSKSTPHPLFTKLLYNSSMTKLYKYIYIHPHSLFNSITNSVRRNIYNKGYRVIFRGCKSEGGVGVFGVGSCFYCVDTIILRDT